jgi:SAM-dependent methyltransferase
MSWWEELYDDLLARVLLERPSDEEIEETARFLVRVLEIDTGARVLDQCCGIGRLAAAVASLGAGVIAVDQALPYVERARALARERAVAVAVHHGDAFEFIACPACHAGYNWWTGFGYAASDAENARMIERARDSLRPGARFALDVPNAPGLVRGFLPSTVDRVPVEGGELVLVRESTLDLARSVLEKRWSYFLPDGKRVERRSALRLYYPHELADMFERTGFEDVKLLGSIRGEPLAVESPRCIVLARRA